MDPNARRRRLPEAWRRRPGPAPTWRRVGAAVVLGWLVFMTVWGFGRSGFPAHERWFLLVGAVAGLVSAVLSARRARPPRDR